jgi:hypothetical protein
VIPQLDVNELINKILKEQLLEQFYRYRWLSFILAPLMLILRVTLVAACIFIGSFLPVVPSDKFNVPENITIQ